MITALMAILDAIGLEVLLVLVLSCLFTYSTWNQMYRKRNLPPGPTPLPLIGNLLQLKRGQMAGSLMELWEQYGPVYTLYLGTRPLVVLCGYQAVREALIDQGEEFGARGRVPAFDKITLDYGIIFSNGERWKQMRSFAFKTLRNYGLGKKSTEGKIQEEAKMMVEEIRKSEGLSLDPTMPIMDAIANIFCYIMFGNRFDYKDEKFRKFIKTGDDIHRLISTTWGQMEEIFPGLMKYIPGPHQKIYTLSDELMEFIVERVKMNQGTLDPNFPRDYIDCFLIKMEQEKQDPQTEFTMKNLLISVQNLFIAGIDTVATTMNHSLLILLTFPEIQAKVHEEIDQVIGGDRMPRMDDRNSMPYTDAVMNEIQRFADIGPLNVTHSVTKDTQFRGYTIPKGTDIAPLLCTVHRDPSQFSTPYEFNPNHFLDENGKFKKNEASMPFSAGKRKCPGESLALMEYFLLLTTILQNFRLTSEKKFTLEDITPKMKGFLNSPIPYELLFIPR
ncbi:cytochrome P450 2A6-like [Discoglossus pictus]